MNAEMVMFAWCFFGLIVFALRIVMREEFMRRELAEGRALPEDSNLKMLFWVIVCGPMVWAVAFMFWIMGTSGCRRG